MIVIAVPQTNRELYDASDWIVHLTLEYKPGDVKSQRVFVDSPPMPLDLAMLLWEEFKAWPDIPLIADYYAKEASEKLEIVPPAPPSEWGLVEAVIWPATFN